jgi:CRISPR-associated protein Csm4
LKTYEIILKPVSGFGTPLKGDSGLFGRSIDKLLSDYATEPFLVVSSAFIRLQQGANVFRYFKRPDMPIVDLFDMEGKSKKEIIEQRKELKAKKWLELGDAKRIEALKNSTFISDTELFEKIIASLDEETRRETRKKGIKSTVAGFSQPHNTINRLTNTTGEGRFAPFAADQTTFLNQLELAVFIGITEGIDIEQVRKALEVIGETGFGRDASTGLGKFKVFTNAEADLFRLGSSKANACYTLAPSVPEQNMYKQTYFTPFTRFGKHGDTLAKSTNPFKNPVIMADEGAVLIPESIDDILKRPYIGTGISNISKAEPKTVMQGYSLYIPVKVEV